MGTRERRYRSNESDRYLASLFNEALTFLPPKAEHSGIALAAVGGYGRAELSPGSDLDILILHNDSFSESELSEFANKLLYPMWDTNSVDHSVRTRTQTRDAAHDDLKVALGLLDIRLVCGDADLVAAVQHDSIDSWRKESRKRLPQLRLSLEERHERAGELAYLLEPDLKEARGGLRDINALRAIQMSGAVDVALERISWAESTLASVRESLHEVTKKNRDRLLFQEQDLVAKHLEYGDADLLMSDVARAARSVDYLLNSTWHRIDFKGKNGLGRILRKPRTTPLGGGISVAHQEVVIDELEDMNADPVIGLRAAAKAAQLGLPLSLDTCARLSVILKEGGAQLSNPWPREARENLVALIGAGSAMVGIFEALDQEEIIFSWIPEWNSVRSLPQRNVLHRHTVDRHMVETAVRAAALTRNVHRPDLLLVGALFHDIGKGTQEDHSERGARLIEPLAKRFGFPQEDIETLKILVLHHLLLSATATRRDLDDPATIASILAVIPDLETLELLHALSIADGEATGRAAWSEWKASLVSELVSRVRNAMSGSTIALQPDISDEQREVAQAGILRVTLEERDSDYSIEIIAPDKPGLLSIVAGVLNLARLDVRSARTKSHGPSAVMKWIVTPDPHAPTITAEKLHRDIEAGLKNSRGIEERINDRALAYAQLPTIPVPAPIVESIRDAATDATVFEVRSHDRPALLFRIGAAVTQSQVDIRSAIVTTLGAEAIDTLYVTEISGGALSDERAREVRERLAAMLK
jgi:[protein-PII] uridylyltransferase